ncbi:hypothetical protein LSH36_8g02028 [Paralvinella palmiformis]|uniref:Uncharacterized protein n=1 Tax=Paralvinella palmiformis TaxID=53620 RepID=A0AAD9NIJ6_9ANNE|nr:hypothetical protein LSH36_8g02028 [Paralvinella palmiformis]
MHTRYYKDIDFIMKSVIDAKDVIFGLKDLKVSTGLCLCTLQVIVRVRCLAAKGGTEYRRLTFKSAKSCSCSVCRNL